MFSPPCGVLAPLYFCIAWLRLCLLQTNMSDPGLNNSQERLFFLTFAHLIFFLFVRLFVRAVRSYLWGLLAPIKSLLAVCVYVLV